jgi:hypothetical protein
LSIDAIGIVARPSSREHILVLLFEEVDDALRDLAIPEHALIGGLLVDHVYGGQQLKLKRVAAHRQLVQRQQHPLDLHLADRVPEEVEGVPLL